MFGKTGHARAVRVGNERRRHKDLARVAKGLFWEACRNVTLNQDQALEHNRDQALELNPDQALEHNPDQTLEHNPDQALEHITSSRCRYHASVACRATES